MTPEEIERLAAADDEMPDDLSMPEQLLFLTLQTLYTNYRSGAVNKSRAKREKSRIYVAYGKLSEEYEIVERTVDMRRRLSKHIGELYKCGCPSCCKLINIFVGVDKTDIPEDVKELYAWNEKLRELVKERSERNAELATTIDRVRWALEKGDIERVKEIVNDNRNN